MRTLFRQYPQAGPWLVIGLCATIMNLGLLALAVSVLGLPFWAAPLASGEVGIILRFLANDRWVFGNRTPTWKRLGQYHVAVAGGFALWWLTANGLVLLGIHYLLAALIAIGASIILNMFTNLCWVWGKSRRQAGLSEQKISPTVSLRSETTPPRAK